MSAEHKMSGTLTPLLSLAVKCVNNFQKNKEYFNTHCQIYPQFTKRLRANHHHHHHQDTVNREIYNQYELNANN